jgi:SAM-dependent methyltransferase
MDAQTARAWIARWDRQQERYIADREERFSVVADVVAHVTANNPQPRILDLGCGPGSMSVRLADHLPKARIIGLDQDPVLLSLARDAYGDVIDVVDTDLAVPGWSAGLDLDGPVDAAVSSTALHWIAPERLGAVYQEVAQLLRPGGVLVNADNLYDDQPALAEIAAAVLEGRAKRVGVTDNEDWSHWWQALAEEPAMAPAFAERAGRGARGGITEFSVEHHAELLRQAGFSEVGTVWQSGNDVVLVGVR